MGFNEGGQQLRVKAMVRAMVRVRASVKFASRSFRVWRRELPCK